MATLTQRALQIAVHERLVRHPGFVEELVRCADEANCGHYPIELLQTVLQTVDRPVDLYDAYVLRAIAQRIGDGSTEWFEINVGATPSRDENVDLNNQALSRLRGVSTGVVWGGRADMDGYVVLESPQYLSGRLVPLEVGYTRADTTFGHILFRGGVARWPYGSKQLTVLVNP